MEWDKLTREERKAEFDKQCIALACAWSKMAFKAEDFKKAAEAISKAFNKSPKPSA